MAGTRIIRKCRWVRLPAAQRSKPLCNPYRGFYTIYKFFAQDEFVPESGCAIEQAALRPEQSLCLIEINLARYQESPLSQEALDRVGRIFAFFAGHNKEMIVRFLYDWDGNGIANEPKEIRIILDHMRQLSPLLKAYTSQIYILQGLFIGSWGEMHSSRYLTERSLIRLAQQLYQCSGEHTYLAVRSPSLWRTIFKSYDPLPESQAYTAGMQARFCLFNDGILASDTDCGTYGTTPRTLSSPYSDKFTREEELEFQDRLCRYVPNGGEAVGASGCDGAAACRTFRRMHISYLNGDYDPGVLKQWRESKAFGDGVWKDKSVYDYIAAHLGYRFCLEQVRLSLGKGGKDRLFVKLQLKNTGFSCCYRRFDVSLVIRTASFSQEYAYPVDTDTRRWLPGLSVPLEAALDCARWDQPEYLLGLRIRDPQSGKQIQLGNSFSGSDYSGMHHLGYLQIVYYERAGK